MIVINRCKYKFIIVLIVDELVYNLLLKDDELSTSFIISQDENLSSNIDTNSSLSKLFFSKTRPPG
jgi:hypothetical protein